MLAGKGPIWAKDIVTMEQILSALGPRKMRLARWRRLAPSSSHQSA